MVSSILGTRCPLASRSWNGDLEDFKDLKLISVNETVKLLFKYVCFRFIMSTPEEYNPSLSPHKCPYTGYLPNCENIEHNYSNRMEMHKYKPPDSETINCTTDLTKTWPSSSDKNVNHASPMRVTRDFHCAPEYGKTDGIHDSLHDHRLHDIQEHHFVPCHLLAEKSESVTPIATGYLKPGKGPMSSCFLYAN